MEGKTLKDASNKNAFNAEQSKIKSTCKGACINCYEILLTTQPPEGLKKGPKQLSYTRKCQNAKGPPAH